MNPADLSALVITYNEAPNIARTLGALGWVGRVLVVDSGSDDGTVESARSFPNTEVVERPFDTFADQCNFGLGLLRTEWVLSLDADYVVEHRLGEEIAALQASAGDAGYRARFRYCVHGRPLRASLLPPRTVLYRRAGARYENEGHGHRVKVGGRVGDLRGFVFHDDRKPLSRWIRSQLTYMEREAAHLLAAPRGELSRPDRLRRGVVLAPVAVPLYCLLRKGLILDGWAGWCYVLQRTFAEVLLALHLLERRVAGGAAESRGDRPA